MIKFVLGQVRFQKEFGLGFTYQYSVHLHDYENTEHAPGSFAATGAVAGTIPAGMGGL